MACSTSFPIGRAWGRRWGPAMSSQLTRDTSQSTRPTRSLWANVPRRYEPSGSSVGLEDV